MIQRGNNRDACFYAEQDYLFYLECLQDACRRFHVPVHAYALMTNHVHLLMTPDSVDGISRGAGRLVTQNEAGRELGKVNYFTSNGG